MSKLLTTLVFLITAMLCHTNESQAQVRDIEVVTPRPAGWMVADVIPMRIVIDVEPGFPLQKASLPPRGSLSYWLELRDIDVQEIPATDTVQYIIDLTYQTFYVPLDVQFREIPELNLVFGEGADATSATVPAWAFSVSPLRGVSLYQQSARQIAPEPDAVQGVLSSRVPIVIVSTSALMLSILSVLLAWHYAVWPFHQRPARPFSVARRHIRNARRDGSEQAYRRALKTLHRAFDSTAHHRVLADDVGQFIETNPSYATLDPDISQFFRVSRYAFFSDDCKRAMDDMPWQSLTQLVRQLAATERRRQ